MDLTAHDDWMICMLAVINIKIISDVDSGFILLTKNLYVV